MMKKVEKNVLLMIWVLKFSLKIIFFFKECKSFVFDLTWKAIDGSLKQEVFVSSLAEKKVNIYFIGIKLI